MKITSLKTNRMTNPLGFSIGKPHFSYLVEETAGKKQQAARVEVAEDAAFKKCIYDSGERAGIDSLAFEPDLALKPRSRYYWRVTVRADNGESATSGAAWFETSKMDEPWLAQWITPELEPSVQPVLFKKITLKKPVAGARMYLTGLGVYELYVNGRKAGDEYLAPGCTAYDKWIQYQTYEIDSLTAGDNLIEIMLGDGWYKGRFGFQGQKNIYGDRFLALAELRVDYQDGTSETFGTDDSWKARKSKIRSCNIYDGEFFDETLEDDEVYGTKTVDFGFEKLKARLSLPVVVNERRKPEKLIETPAGELVLDMGQNMAGWIEFQTSAPKGKELMLQYGEVLQDGNFYQDNLRTAKQKFQYIAGGGPKTVRPHFTFYGFRFVKLTGWDKPVDLADFTGCVLHSRLERTGTIETSDPLVNRLFLNALWGQKSNFLDVPTDCPQRDERMGWTGDAQVFSGTASLNMDTYAFYTKYGYDLKQEQKALHGSVPFVVPMCGLPGHGSSVWGEAATVIPWNMYLYFGDRAILERQFESMKAWVDYIRSQDLQSGGHYLWTTGFHFGDWLALDGKDIESAYGGTDTAFIASIYYCYSAGLVAKAAKVLGKEDLCREYEQLSEKVRLAVRNEYVTPSGRLAIDTQTACVLALFMHIVLPEHRARVANDLKRKLKENGNHLTTGFVGTYFLCRVLSTAGMNKLAYTLLLNEDYPGWLYEVKLGATTIWERWNSLLPDGKISGTGMNSLNHYAYGSIVEWMYRYMAGINPVESCPGFRRARIAPQPDYRISWVKAETKTAAGLYRSEWRICGKSLQLHIVVPFNASAEIVLPNALLENVRVNGSALAESGMPAVQRGDTVAVEAETGDYVFQYPTIKAYRKVYGRESTLGEILENKGAREVLLKHLPRLSGELDRIRPEDRTKTLDELTNNSFVPLSEDLLRQIDAELENVE